MKIISILLFIAILISCSNNFDPDNTYSDWLNGTWYNKLDTLKAIPVKCSANGDSVFIEYNEKGNSGNDSLYILKGVIKNEYKASKQLKIQFKEIPYFVNKNSKPELKLFDSDLMLYFNSEEDFQLSGFLSSNKEVFEIWYKKKI